MVQLDFPAETLLLDFLDEFIREIGGHVSRYLLWYDARWYAGVNVRVLAVHLDPFGCEGEMQFGLIVQCHFVAVLRLVAVEDAGLREIRFHKLHDGGVYFAQIHNVADFYIVPLLLGLGAFCHAVHGFNFGAGHSEKGQCRDGCDDA